MSETEIKPAYLQDHWSALAYWVKHGGPHMLWICGILGALYSFGIVDVPAWSKDVARIEKILKINTVKLNNYLVDEAVAQERFTNQQRQLDKISENIDKIIGVLIVKPNRYSTGK